MHGPDRSAAATLMLCAFATVAAVDTRPAGWTIDGTCPQGASALASGVRLTGRGTVWCDDLELTIVDEREVASTDILPQERVYRTLGREPATLARRPRNLGFEE